MKQEYFNKNKKGTIPVVYPPIVYKNKINTPLGVFIRYVPIFNNLIF